MRILFIGEIVGSAGIYCVKALLPGLKRELGIDLTIAAAEAATGGFGIGKGHAVYLHKLGVDVITAGDFAYFKRDAVSHFGQARYLLRPANYPYGNPGRGWLVARPRPDQPRPAKAQQGAGKRHAAAAAKPATASRAPAAAAGEPVNAAPKPSQEPPTDARETSARPPEAAAAAVNRPVAAEPGNASSGGSAVAADTATATRPGGSEPAAAGIADDKTTDAAGHDRSGAAGNTAADDAGRAAAVAAAEKGSDTAGDAPAGNAADGSASAGAAPAAAALGDSAPAGTGNAPAAQAPAAPKANRPRHRPPAQTGGGRRNSGRRSPAPGQPSRPAGPNPPSPGVGVVSLLGQAGFSRVHLRNPFEIAGGLIERVKQQTPIVLVDFHATTTSEKVAMSLFLDGKVTALIGTHVRTLSADARLLPGGTAAITHSGRTGSLHSVGGLDPEVETRKFLTQIHEQSRDAWGLLELQGVVLDVGADGAAKSISTLRRQTTAPEAARKAAEAARNRGPRCRARPAWRRAPLSPAAPARERCTQERRRGRAVEPAR